MSEDDAGMDFEQVRQFIEKSDQIKELDKELKAQKAQLEEMKTALIDRFANAGVSSIRVDGKTVYTHRQLWAGKAALRGPDGEEIKDKGKRVTVNGDDYIAALKAAGLEELVYETVSASALSAWVREIEQEGDDGLPVLPPELDGFVEVTERFDIRIRKSK